MRISRFGTAQIAAAMAVAMAAPSAAAFAQTAAPPSPRVCLRSYEIDHTYIPNDNTIYFFMKDHTAYKNTLTSRCVGLRLETNGFSYEPTDPGTDEICSNVVTIRLRTTGSTCFLGAFDRAGYGGPGTTIPHPAP